MSFTTRASIDALSVATGRIPGEPITVAEFEQMKSEFATMVGNN